MKQEELLVREINDNYVSFVNDNHYEPNVAYVNCKWNSGEIINGVQTIALDTKQYSDEAAANGEDFIVPYIKDEEVLFYCSTIGELLDLCNKDNGEDFVITGFIDFGYLENNI